MLWAANFLTFHSYPLSSHKFLGEGGECHVIKFCTLTNMKKLHLNVFICEGTLGNKDFEKKINTSRCRMMIIFEIQQL